jgi:predicted RNase H-like HicB family nuclease
MGGCCGNVLCVPRKQAQDQYLQFVRWNGEDKVYVGYCPDLFPAGGVCHGATPVEAFTRLSEIVAETLSTA